MPESLVQVTEGTGKKLHTWQKTIGANTVEDEIVILGDQYQATYTVTTGFGIAASTALSHGIQVMAGASLNVYIRRIKVTQVAMATAAVLTDLNLTRLTTAGTGGTVLTTVAFDTTDAASGATAMSLPTVKGTEGTGPWREAVYWLQTMPVSGGAGTGTVFDFDADRLRSKPIRIPAGTANGLAVKFVTAPAVATCAIEVLFTEANF